jgi:glyoxylase-like metal-dependent hydrolase (beta-lactamase superfamily II)
MLTLATMAPVLTAITDRVHFAQTDLVNWTLVSDNAGVMLIDAGFPGSRDDVLASLRQLGFGVEDVRAILLTHAHIDHFGSAIWFAKTHGTPVYCHADEVGHAKREYLEQASLGNIATHVWQPRWLKWTLAIAAKGALVRDGIPTTRALTEEVGPELPGAPMAIPSHGHTSGHCSYVVDGVLVGGDALVTGHPVSTRRGPQLLPDLFNHDQHGCVRSLAALGMLDTDVLLPGHGPLWRGPIRDATALALGSTAIR